MAERIGQHGLIGIESQASLMPTALQRFDTMVSLVRHLDDPGRPPAWRSQSDAHLNRLAQGVLLSPGRQRKQVYTALNNFLSSKNEREKEMGRTLEEKFIKAKEALGL